MSLGEFLVPRGSQAGDQWKLDNSANSVTGKTNGTPNAMSYGSGRLGGNISCGIFNGSSSRINLPGAPNYMDVLGYGDSPWTAAAWVKMDTNANGQIVGCIHLASSKDYGWELGVWGGYPAVWSAKGTGSTADVDYALAVSSIPIGDGKWHFVAGVWTGTYLILYIDGVYVNVKGWAYAPAYNSYELGTIGVHQYSAGNYSEYFPGSIDDVTILWWALTQQDIRRWYAWTKGMLV